MTDTTTARYTFPSRISFHAGDDLLDVEAHTHDDGDSGWITVANALAIHADLDQLEQLGLRIASTVAALRSANSERVAS